MCSHLVAYQRALSRKVRSLRRTLQEGDFDNDERVAMLSLLEHLEWEIASGSAP